jgi:hypothetical protein
MLVVLPTDILLRLIEFLDVSAFMEFRKVILIPFSLYFTSNPVVSLRQAATFNSVPLLEYLLSSKTMVPFALHGALEEAAVHNFLPIVEYIGSKLPVGEYCGIALPEACQRGYLDVVKYLYTIDSKLSHFNGMVMAMESDQEEIVRWLHTQGVRLDLHLVARRGSFRMFKLLESLGEDLTAGVANSACCNIYDNTEILAYLYRLGLRATAEGLYCACRFGHLSIIRCLLLQNHILFEFQTIYKTRSNEFPVLVTEFLDQVSSKIPVL